MDYANYDLSSVLLGLVAVLPLGLGALYVLARAEKRRLPRWNPWPKTGPIWNRFHQCFCGNAGFIEGTIKTIEANQSAVETEPDATKTPTQQGITTKTAQSAATLLTTKGNDLSKQSH